MCLKSEEKGIRKESAMKLEDSGEVRKRVPSPFAGAGGGSALQGCEEGEGSLQLQSAGTACGLPFPPIGKQVILLGFAHG
jgi:hypothetical protein